MIPPIAQPLPDVFRRIRLALARDPDHPTGRAEDGYTLILPLAKDGAVNGEFYQKYRDAFRVVRHTEDETSVGHIVHGPRGSWRLDYDIQGEPGQEAIFRLRDERLVPGEYLSIERKGALRTFKIVSIEPV